MNFNLSDGNESLNSFVLPLNIDGEQFVIEINDIRNIEYIDLNESDGSVLDKVNGVLPKMNKDDKNFFKEIIKTV